MNYSNTLELMKKSFIQDKTFGFDLKENLPLLLSLSLGSKSQAMKVVNKYYKEHKYECMKAFKKWKFRNEECLYIHNPVRQLDIRKSASVVAYCTNNLDKKQLFEFVKHGFKDYERKIRQAKGNGVNVFCEELLNSQFKKHKVEAYRYNDTISDMIAILWLCEYYKVDALYHENTMGALVYSFDDENSRTNKLKLLDENRHVLDYMEDILQMKKPVNSTYSLQEYLFENLHDNMDFTEGESSDIFSSIGNMLDTCSVNSLDVNYFTKFTKTEIELCMFEVAINLINNVIKVDNARRMFMTYLYITGVCKLYNNTKDLIFDKIEDEHMYEVSEIKRNAEKEIASYKREALEESHKAKVSSDKLSMAHSEVEKLKKEVERLINQLEISEQYKDEAIALRTHVYNSRIEANDSEKISTADMISDLNSYKLMFMGGHPKWLHKIQDTLDNIKIIGVDEVNRSFSSLRTHDFVIVNTSYLNHGFYRKLMKELPKYDTKLIYADEFDNMDLVIEHIYKAINE